MNRSKHWSIVLALAALLPMHNVSAEVVTVSNPNGGAILSTLQDIGKSIQNVDSLVVTGTLNDADYYVLKEVMESLAWLDLSGTDITEIPDFAFQDCLHLVEVTFPTSLTTIGDGAFWDCKNLVSVQGCENITTLKGRAFFGCGLRNLPFGDKVEYIDGSLIFNDRLDVDLVMPGSIKTLSIQSFMGTGIKSLDLSNCSLDIIQGECFRGCNNLKSVILPNDHAYSISGYAFAEDTLLTYIRIPGCVTEIGEGAFAQDKDYFKARTIIIDSQVPIKAHKNAFSLVFDENLTIWVPTGSLNAYSESEGYMLAGNIREHGFAIDIDGKGYVSFMNGEYTDGSACLPTDDNLPKSFTFVPSTGYEVESVTLNGTPVSLTDNGFVVDAGTISGTFKVRFVPKALHLTVSYTAGGQVKYNNNSVSSGTVLNVMGGENVKFSLVPDEGCFVKSLKYNGAEVALIDGMPVYETPILPDDATVVVEFGTPQESVNFVKVSVDRFGAGTIQCNGSNIDKGSYILLEKGSSPVFMFVPGVEGQVQSLLINSFDMVSYMNDNTLSLNNLVQDVLMKVDFYSTVDVQIDSPNGQLREILSDAGIALKKIKFLKLTGGVTERDLSVISSMLILQSLDLSETTLTEIPDDTFKESGFLKVALPLSLVKIGSNAFLNCRSLEEINGFENIRRIEASAFAGCNALQNLPYGDKIESIGYCVFEDCQSIPRDIVMYSSLREIGGVPFGWDILNSIDLSLCTFENTSISYYVFSGATSVLLPEKGNYSLGDLAGSKIKSIIIPSAVTSIGFNFVDGAEQLKDIYMRSSVPPAVGASSFNSSVSGITLHVPSGSIDLYNTLRPWRDFGSIVEYGIGIESDRHGVIYANGKRVQDDTTIFPDGEATTVRLVPNPGYEVTQVLLDGNPLVAQANGTYLIPAGKDDGTLSVGWKLKKYGITVNYQGNGAILSAGRELTNGEVLMVDSASVVRFDIVPANGYLVKDISFNGLESVVQNGGTVYVTPSISGASTLDLTFAEQSGSDGVYKFDIATGNNGAVIYRNTTLLQETTINISAGQDAVFEIVPNQFYKIKELTFNGVDVTESVIDNKFTINNVSAAGSISVSFCVDTKATVVLNAEGSLGSLIISALQDTLEWLIVTGPMNDADFSVIRTDLSHLKTLDLSGAEITDLPDGALYASTVENVILPSTLTDLGSNAFKGCKGITSIKIPGGVKVINDHAFEDCSSLVSVEFSEGLVTIGDAAFKGSGIANADFPSSLREIKVDAFQNCGGLISVSLKRNLNVIDVGAFAYCSALKSVEIPSSVSSINYGAFLSCSNLETVILSEGLSFIGREAFSNCKMLRFIDLPSSLRTMESYAFIDCRSLEKVTIGSGLSSLEEATFARCPIDSIIIPSTVRTIKNNVFYECHDLVYVSLPEGLTSIWGGAFYDCRNLVSINLPQSLNSIGSGAFKNDVRLSDLVIPESVTSIESEAFYECRSLSSLSIPTSVKSIGINALRGIPMVKMASATPPAITSAEQFEDYTAIVIPDGAYDTYCNTPYWKQYKNQFTTEGNLIRVVNVEQDSTGSNLSVVIGEQNLPFVVGLKIVGTINSYDIMIMRNKMTLLRNLDLSEATIVANDYEYYQGSHTENNVIGPNSFRDINLCSVVLPANVKRIGSTAFHNCRYLTGIVIPDAVEYIDDNAFSNCSLLKTAYIGNGVKTIESDAFRECDNLTDLHLGKNLSAIGNAAFYSCDNLKNIEFGKKLLYIAGWAFSDCFSLTDVVLPGSLIEIGEYAFNNCSRLKEVKIPSSVKNIREGAFNGCPLEKVYTYTIEPTSINQNTFSCYKTASLYVPATSYYNYYWNTQWSQFTELVEFNEPYEYFYLNGDYELDDKTGRIAGEPDMEMNQTSGITVEGDDVQEISSIELNFDYSNEDGGENNDAGPSIIAGSGETTEGVANLVAQCMNVNIGVDGNRWYFFCFPFDLAMDSVECTSDFVFYSYDGLRRSQGLSGWTKVGADVTLLNKGNGYIFQSSRTGVLTIHVSNDYLQFEGKSEKDILHAYESDDIANASWNFLGNPFISYYDVQDLAKEYDAPIVVWNGYGYDVYKPGDDDYQLKPFEAFFVQKTSGKTSIEFLPESRITYNEAKIHSANAAARSAKRAIEIDRQLVNIMIMGQDSVTDKTRIVYSTKASMDYEIGVDAAKFHADGVPQIYTLNGTTKYAINERPMGGDEIKLGYVAPKAGTYTLSVPRHDADVEIYDNVTKSKVDFTFGDYTFQSKAGTYNDRFVVRKASGGVTAVENGFRLDGMTVTAVNGGIEVEGRVTGKVSVYSESGMLLDEITRAGRIELVDGVYIIKIGDKSVKMNVVL